MAGPSSSVPCRPGSAGTCQRFLAAFRAVDFLAVDRLAVFFAGDRLAVFFAVDRFAVFFAGDRFAVFFAVERLAVDFLAVDRFAGARLEVALLAVFFAGDRLAVFLAVDRFAVFFAGDRFAVFLAVDFFAVFLAAFLAAFLAVFLAVDAVALEVVFFAGLAAAATVGSFLSPDTTALSSAPARNFGTDVFLACTRSPVRGLRTIRAGRLVFSKAPNPVMATFSPRATSRAMVSRTASSASDAARLLPSKWAASVSMNWDLFTGLPFVNVVEPAPDLLAR